MLAQHAEKNSQIIGILSASKIYDLQIFTQRWQFINQKIQQQVPR